MITIALAFTVFIAAVLPVAVASVIRTHRGIMGELAPVIGRMPTDLDTGES